MAIDLRGHGRSDWPGEYTFELMRDDVIGVLVELGARDLVLVGHSMGGTVVVAGGPTSHVPQELLVEVSERISECALVTIPVGHNIHAARPEVFNEVVERWLSQAD